MQWKRMLRTEPGGQAVCSLVFALYMLVLEAIGQLVRSFSGQCGVGAWNCK